MDFRLDCLAAARRHGWAVFWSAQGWGLFVLVSPAEFGGQRPRAKNTADPTEMLSKCRSVSQATHFVCVFCTIAPANHHQKCVRIVSGRIHRDARIMCVVRWPRCAWSDLVGGGEAAAGGGQATTKLLRGIAIRSHPFGMAFWLPRKTDL